MSIVVQDIQGSSVNTALPIGNGPSLRLDKELKVLYQLLSHSSMGSERALQIYHLALAAQDGMPGLDTIFHIFPTSIQNEITSALQPKALQQLLSICLSSSHELFLTGLLNLAKELAFTKPELSLALARSVTEMEPLVLNQGLYAEKARYLVKRISGFGNAGDQFYVGLNQFAYQEPWKALPIYVAGGKMFEVVAGKLGAVLPNTVWARLGTYALAQSAEVATVASGQSVVFGTDWWTNLKHNSVALPIFRGVGVATGHVARNLNKTSPAVQDLSLPVLAPASQLASLALVHQAEIKLGWRPESGIGNFAAGVLAEFVPLYAGQKIVEVARHPVALSFLETFGRLQIKFNQLLAKLPVLETPYAWETGSKVRPILAVSIDDAATGGAPLFNQVKLGETQRVGGDTSWPSRIFTTAQILAMEGPIKRSIAFQRGIEFTDFKGHLKLIVDLLEANILTPDLARSFYAIVVESIESWTQLMQQVGTFDGVLKHDFNNITQSFSFMLSPPPRSAYSRDILISVASIFNDAIDWFAGNRPLLQQSSWERWMKSTLLSDVEHSILKRGDLGAVAPGLWILLLKNLVGNSMRYADYARKLAIKIEIEPGRFIYEDNAQGIAEQHLDGLFNYGNRAGRTDDVGTGIGTYLVAQIVAFHGGTLTIASQPGAGTRYEINFPKVNGHAVSVQ